MTHRLFPTYEKLKGGDVMNGICLVLICISILLLCFVCVYTGVFIGVRITSKSKERSILPESSEEQRRRIEKMRREYSNFLSYNGTEQGED